MRRLRFGTLNSSEAVRNALTHFDDIQVAKENLEEIETLVRHINRLRSHVIDRVITAGENGSLVEDLARYAHDLGEIGVVWWHC